MLVHCLVDGDISVLVCIAGVLNGWSKERTARLAEHPLSGLFVHAQEQREDSCSGNHF